MQSLFFWLAAGSSLATFAVHTFLGGVVVARPLLADRTLPRASKWLNYYCWHITTLLLLALAGGFAFAAVRADGVELAWFGTGLSIALSLLSAAVALKGRINPLRFPSTSLFALTAVLGIAGLA